jgi:hypothetical protein
MIFSVDFFGHKIQNKLFEVFFFLNGKNNNAGSNKKVVIQRKC